MDFSSYPETSSTRNDSIADKKEGKTFNVAKDFELIVILYVSGSISVTGLISNVLSLSFFLTNWSKKLGEKLLVLLNIFDLIVCLCSCVNFFLLYHPNNAHHIIKKLLQASYYTFVESTGFITTFLTLVRTFSTYHVFRKPNEKFIVVSFAVSFIYSASKAALCVGLNYSIVDAYNIMLLISLCICILAVFVGNVLTMAKLLCSSNLELAASPSARKNREATITILILSVSFCFLNTLYAIVLFNGALGKETITAMFRKIIVYSSVPLNSALNPFVYICRKREMRKFFFRKLSKCFCDRSESYAVANLELPTCTRSVIVNSLIQ